MSSLSVSIVFFIDLVKIRLADWMAITWIIFLNREGDECNSRDEGHHGDEEDSNATSISDAMIDDEIADQPGLVMLGQVKNYLFSNVFFRDLKN